MPINENDKKCCSDMINAIRTGKISEIPDSELERVSQLLQISADTWYQSSIQEDKYSSETKKKIYGILTNIALSMQMDGNSDSPLSICEDICQCIGNICVLYLENKLVYPVQSKRKNKTFADQYNRTNWSVLDIYNEL